MHAQYGFPTSPIWTQNRPVRVFGSVGSHTGTVGSSVQMILEARTRLAIKL